MNPYPQPQSVLVLNNCNIHKSKILQEIIEVHGQLFSHEYPAFLITIVGCILKFLPPYSPDMNPIEESFSAGVPKPHGTEQLLTITYSESLD